MHKLSFPVLGLPLLAVLAACAPKAPETAAPLAPEAVPAPVARPVMGSGQDPAALDATSDRDKAAALAGTGGAGRELGRVTVALGSPAEQGYWLRTSLVTVPANGRVVLASGASVAVELRPGTGGALLSLAAYRALGLALTDLPEVTVRAD